MNAEHGLLRVLVIDDERPALDELALPARARPARRRRADLRLGHRGAADPAGPRRRRGLPRHPDAGADRARPGPGARAVPDPAAGRLRDRPRGARGRRVRAARRRLRPQAGARGPPRRSGTPRGRGRRAAAGQRRRADPGRARRRHPVRQPLRHHATSRRTATTPGCTPRPTPTCCARRCPRWRRSGRRPASSGSTGRCWSRWRTSTRCGWTPAGARSSSAAHELAVSRRHTRELRDLLTRRNRPT